MANSVRIRASVNDNASGPIDRIRDKFENLRKQGLKGFGIGVGAAITAKGLSLVGSALDRVGQAFADSISNASKLQQATGAIESVFGSAAGRIEKFGRTAAESAGLSQRAVKEMAAVIGSQLQGMGFSADGAAVKTVELQKRAADMAATFGGPVEDAVSAITALMRGERDPIERFGVSIKAADVQARILALGLDTSTTAAKKNAEAIAGLDLLMQQTAKTTGQFARESEQLAGAQARAAAHAENASAKFGEEFALMVGSIASGAIKVGTVVDEMSGNVVRHFTGEMDPAILESGREWEAYQKQISVSMGLGADSVSGGVNAMADKVGELPQLAADQLLANQQKLADATTELVNFMDKALSPAEEVFAARAFLASDAYKEGINSGIPAVRQKAQELAEEAQRVLDQYSNGYGPGSKFSSSFGHGMVDSGALSTILNSARKVALAARGVFPGSEPKDPSSPLRGITKAFGFTDVLAKGMSDVSGVRSAAMRAAGAMVPDASGGGGFNPGGASGAPAIHSHIYLDGRQIYEGVDRQAHYDRTPATLLPRN